MPNVQCRSAGVAANSVALAMAPHSFCCMICLPFPGTFALSLTPSLATPRKILKLLLQSARLRRSSSFPSCSHAK
jgi:hypothetical protein